MKHRLPRRMRIQWTWSLVLLLLLVALVVARSEGATTKHETALDSTAGVVYSTDQTLPATPTLAGMQFNATKQAILDNDQARMDAAKTKVAQNALPTKIRTPFSTPRPQNTPGPGLGECVGGGNSFSLTSCWAGTLGNGYIHVIAGSIGGNRSQGALTVYTSTLTGKMGHSLVYESPDKEGPLNVAYVIMPRITLIASHGDRPATRFVFNLETRQWEDTNVYSCSIYPIAFREDSFLGIGISDAKRAVPLNTQGAKLNPDNGAFAWLSFTSKRSAQGGSIGLPVPGESVGLINPDYHGGIEASVGNWLQAQQNIGSDAATVNSFDFLEKSGFIVPVPLWNQERGQGANKQYRVSGFAWIRFRYHTAFPPSDLTMIYWGEAACPDR